MTYEKVANVLKKIATCQYIFLLYLLKFHHNLFSTILASYGKS